jgi:hypothetical protein
MHSYSPETDIEYLKYLIKFFKKVSLRLDSYLFIQTQNNVDPNYSFTFRPPSSRKRCYETFIFEKISLNQVDNNLVINFGVLVPNSLIIVDRFTKRADTKKLDLFKNNYKKDFDYFINCEKSVNKLQNTNQNFSRFIESVKLVSAISESREVINTNNPLVFSGLESGYVIYNTISMDLQSYYISKLFAKLLNDFFYNISFTFHKSINSIVKEIKKEISYYKLKDLNSKKVTSSLSQSIKDSS